ncbi:MAG: hypothetical protein JWQ89_3788 [Devosia sp.]|uniref:hypothetical protein n=1 Tax=Devosia sp. TaxID=1871048 RepID=UPI0026288A78|nr:hypothetical protein [Devosia sp.]MDB5542061.1 hypothetical protein [Devosia sp.]
MSARIAPEPISTGLGAVGDYRSRRMLGDSYAAPDAPDTPQPPPPQNAPAQLPAPVPAPPPAPGSAFAAALLSGQVPPKRTGEREIILRLGSTDLPAQGSLALHDRLV